MRHTSQEQQVGGSEYVLQAAEKLWQLVRTEGKIMQHLAALRDYFLMGRGDFWQNFLLEVMILLFGMLNTYTAFGVWCRERV